MRLTRAFLQTIMATGARWRRQQQPPARVTVTIGGTPAFIAWDRKVPSHG